jgi:hypothetical protein
LSLISQWLNNYYQNRQNATVATVPKKNWHCRIRATTGQGGRTKRRERERESALELARHPPTAGSRESESISARADALPGLATPSGRGRAIVLFYWWKRAGSKMGSGSFLKVLANNFDVLAGYDFFLNLLFSLPRRFIDSC